MKATMNKEIKTMKKAESAAGRSSVRYLLELAESCRGLLVSSVVFAVLGAVSGIVPYLAVSGMIIRICSGNYCLRDIGLTASMGWRDISGSLFCPPCPQYVHIVRRLPCLKISALGLRQNCRAFRWDLYSTSKIGRASCRERV